MGEVYLVRHGQASFGAADYDQLSDLGHAQARHLGAWFGDCGVQFGRVVTGSLRRHRETAAGVLETLPAPLTPLQQPEIDTGFNEYDHTEILTRHCPALGDPAQTKQLLAQASSPGRAVQRIFTEAMQRWLSSRHDDDYTESWNAFRSRCLKALWRLAEGAGEARRVVVFTSGGPIAAICQSLLDLPDHRMIELNQSIVNSAVTKLLCQPGRVSLSYLNNFAHLERAGTPDAVSYR
jgi:broad specificity phosphatase PhoE